MDIEDEGWVNIPYDGLLEVHDDDGGKKFFSRKFVRSPKNLFKMNYFDSSQNSQEFVDSSSEDDLRSPKKLIAFPIHMDDHQVIDHHEEVKEITKLPILVDGVLEGAPEPDQDPIFQVFFKKENEFVEMKMDSPRSGSRRITSPYIETDLFQFEDKGDEHMFNGSSPSKVVIDKIEKVKEEGNEGLNIWKRGLNGIGAFCSLGMAAVTICIILFGNGQRHRQNQKIRIQLYSDDKRIKQVVHHANEAMSAVRGVPLTTAHITYGGYYEGF
ncbi:hypothetical protein HanRHA438_Chr14g0650221 [Helianthus annuus]|uniref:DUF6821 domain-containing protein n=1 Tax=Helianthus annuus TaxID=4232 RepID=A0A251SJV2_HELAN|nr:uncharacterized protein LOC110908751 [Helianthus annuus]KAF5768716.1 hypothetical protein HanXRQr2_Chr14g0639761 [Helianthus annuus]KAJ0468227.1 hypothetical protein HanIR_Chr14g0694221 [Helianthus annuus]KAJ0485406.1 hypothetical protein HanHA89_Chr14g0567951 [Helianthus annuus]KAJ0655956.1 hypothetical protein HanLR1_Chr14g0530301 [Helianthus annuus]KAJ0659631.1 hypothetical protein HanOQP8_Chr14g0528371 [Helianthus annuus]